MPLVPQADTREPIPPWPANRTHRLLCIRVIDKGMVTTEYPPNSGNKNTNHKIMLVHESNAVIDDPNSKYNGKPWLLFSTMNFYYGKQGKKRPVLVGVVEKHLKRDLTDEEKGWAPGDMFDLESLVGMTCKAYIEVKESGWAFASSWQYDIDDDGKELEPWERRSDWVPREERQQDTSFNYGSNKPSSETNNAEAFFS